MKIYASSEMVKIFEERFYADPNKLTLYLLANIQTQKDRIERDGEGDRNNQAEFNRLQEEQKNLFPSQENFLN